MSKYIRFVVYQKGDWGTKIILVDKVNKISFLLWSMPCEYANLKLGYNGRKISEGWMYKMCYVDLKHFKMYSLPFDN